MFLESGEAGRGGGVIFAVENLYADSAMKNTLNIPLTAMAPGLPVTECRNLRSDAGVLRAVDPAAPDTPVRHDSLIAELLEGQPTDLTPPDIFFRVIGAGNISESIPALSLTDTDFSRDNPLLSDKGVALLSRELTDAYSRLCDRASESGLFFQPVLARLHLLDRSGNRIWSSAPQLLETAAFQCCSTITLTCSKEGTTLKTPSASLTAGVYRVEAVIAALGAYSEAVSAEATLSPQIHPTDPAATAPFRLTRTDTSTPGLTTALPGTTDSFASRADRRAGIIRSLLPRMTLIERRIALFEAAEGYFPLANKSAPALREENAAIASALRKELQNDPSGSAAILRRISSPGGFRAGVVTVSGDAVVWGDITVLHAPAAIPRHHSVSPSADTPWEGVLRLNLADGTTRSRAIASPLPLPSALPAVLCIPCPEATSVEMWVRKISDGSVSHALVTLSPSDDASWAIAVSRSLEPVMLTPWIGSLPAGGNTPSDEGIRYPGAVVTASAERPYAPLGALLVTTEPIVALHPAVRSASSWDFTRTRLYAFSPAGIFSVAFSRGGTRPASALIDPQSVSRAGATAYTTSGIMALTDGGILLRVAGAATSRLLDNVGADTLRWFIPADDLRMKDSLTGAQSALELRSMQLHSLLGSDNDLIPVKWSVRMPLGSARRVTGMRIAMAATRFKGSLELRGDFGAGTAASRRLISFAIDGEVNAPLTARVLAFPCSFVTLTIDGSASADMTVTGISLTF